MRNIINMIIKIAIIWGAAWMFPEYVKIQDTRTIVLVVATLLIASIVLTVIMMGALILAALPGNGVGIGIAMLITIIMALASGIIQLMAAVHFVPGFEIHGKLTYIILALLMAVFSIEETLTITDVLLIGTQGTVQRLLQDDLTGQIYPINNVFVSIINNAMVEEDKGEYTVTEPLFNPFRGILWKNNVCKLRAHFRTDDKNIKVLKSLKGVDITPEVPEE